jgi:tetratricopeptide (TPR) repeat protein
VRALPCVLVLLLQGVATASPEDVARDVQAARALLAAGRADEARRLAEGLVRRSAGEPESLELLAEASYALADRDALREVGERLRERWPDRPTGYALPTRFLVDAGDVDAAIALYRRLLERRPQDPSARLVVAGLLRWQARDADAAAEYERAAALAAPGSDLARAAEAGRDAAREAVQRKARLRGRRNALWTLAGGALLAFAALFLVLHRATRRPAGDRPRRPGLARSS